MKFALLFSALGLLLSSPFLPAQESSAEETAYLAETRKLVDSLKFQDGEVALRGGLAKIKPPSELRYLGPDDAKKVLEGLWGNPPSQQKTLGLLVPSNVSLASQAGWAVIITYEEDGFVKDDDANKINYDDLLKDMKASVKESSEERVKEGYGSIELVGWAEPPRYDAAAKKMYWAKELQFDGSPERTLNYNIRVLGRRGVLVLNAVAGMGQLADIHAATPLLLSTVDFQEGHRYADYEPGKDKVATYGLAALVTGGVLAKSGMLKVLLGALLAGKKFVIIGVIAVFAIVKKFITGRSSET